MKEYLPQIMDQVIIPILSIVLTGLVAWLGKKVADWFNLQEENTARKTFGDALQNAANLIVQGTKNLATAAKYVNDRVPEARDILKITPEQVPDMVSSRVPAARVAEVIPESSAPVIKVPEPAVPTGT